MSDVTAQAFREAAAPYEYSVDDEQLYLRQLLLAAAEQREQWEAAEETWRGQVTFYRALLDEVTEERDAYGAANHRYTEQIATLTAEVKRYQAENARLWADQLPRAEENDRLREQLATITAERDTYKKALVTAHVERNKHQAQCLILEAECEALKGQERSLHLREELHEALTKAEAAAEQRAQVDEANQRHYACYDELLNVRHELEEARAKLATTTALLNQLITP